MNLQWQEINLDNQQQLTSALALYDSVFDRQIREPHQVFINSFLNGEGYFHFLTGIDENQMVVSLATVHYLPEVNVGFIVYLANHPSVRGQGIGIEMLTRVQKLLTKDAIAAGYETLSGLVLETEKEELAETEDERKACQLRTRFFEKNGYHHFPFTYVQPALHPDEKLVPLHLFYKPIQEINFDMRDVVREIYKEKYEKMNNISRDQIDEYLRYMGIK